MAKKQKTNPSKPRQKKPKDQPLPGLGDRRIQALEDAAEEYAEIRDRRMALNTEEVSLKASILRTMAKLGKTIYRHAGVTIQVVEGEPDCKVRIKKPKEGEDVDEPETFEAGQTDGSNGNAEAPTSIPDDPPF